MPAPPESSFRFRGFVPRFCSNLCRSIAHLFCGDDLKWSQCGLQVGGVGLKIVESASNAGLKL